MKIKLLYVELIQDTAHTGPAWIGYGQVNRTGKTIYFDGKILGHGRSIIGNHVDIVKGDEYWISGIKKNGQDRHWAGKGKIQIDKSSINEYLKIINELELPKDKFIIVELNNVPQIELATKIENTKLNSY